MPLNEKAWSCLVLASPLGQRELLRASADLGTCHKRTPELLPDECNSSMAFYYLVALDASLGLVFRTAKDGKVSVPQSCRGPRRWLLVVHI